MAITQQDREEWSQHPVTIEFAAALRESRLETADAWARELYVGATGEQTLLMNAKALGGIDMLNKTLELLDTYKPHEVTSTKTGAHNDLSSY